MVLLKDRAHESVVGVIHLAKHRGLLNAERAAWAEEVYGAGNLAIHKHEAFQKKYPAERVEELFRKARAVVEALYRRDV